MFDDVPDARLIRITEALLQKTLTSEIQWERRKYRSGEQFDCSTTDMTITIKSDDNEGNHPFRMIIKNENGVELERLTSQTHASDEYSETLRLLWVAARRQALNIDSAIDQLAASLGIETDEPSF